VCFYSHFMSLAHNIEPAIPVQFLRAKALSYARTEHFGPAARKHLNPGRFQTGKNIFDGCPLIFCKMGDLDGCKCFDKDIRLCVAYPPDKVLKKRKTKVGVAASHDVYLGQSFSVRADFIENFILGKFE